MWFFVSVFEHIHVCVGCARHNYTWQLLFVVRSKTMAIAVCVSNHNSTFLIPERFNYNASRTFCASVPADAVAPGKHVGIKIFGTCNNFSRHFWTWFGNGCRGCWSVDVFLFLPVVLVFSSNHQTFFPFFLRWLTTTSSWSSGTFLNWNKIKCALMKLGNRLFLGSTKQILTTCVLTQTSPIVPQISRIAIGQFSRDIVH